MFYFKISYNKILKDFDYSFYIEESINSDPMFESIFNNPGIIEITFIMMLLVAVALLQKLKQAAVAIGITYVLYLIYIIFSFSTPNEIINNDFSKELTPKQKKVENMISIDETLAKELKALKTKGNSQEENIDTLKKNKTLIVVKDIKIEPIKGESIQSLTIFESNIEKPLKVLSIQLGRDLADRELVDIDSLFSVVDNRIYCMTKIENKNELNTIYHDWYQDNILRSRVKMEIRWSYSWRTWSYISINPKKVGNWKVVIEDSLGLRLDSLAFQISNNPK